MRFQNLFRSVLTTFLCFSLIICAIPAYASETTYIYVSPDGNDYGSGNETDPLLTLSAAFSKLDGGGTVVITGALSSDVTILNAAVTQKCKNTRPITITGKNPRDGKIYQNASIPLNSPRLWGEMRFEYINIAPVRNYAFFNTYGNKLVFGEGITNSDFDLYIHGGSYGNGSVASSDIEISSGNFNTVYLGGAFCVSQDNGVWGNTRITVNGGSVSNLIIGFDSNSTQSSGTIAGNVMIRHNGGLINKITSKKIVGDSVGGYISIITTGGLSAMTELPKAQKGIYRIIAEKHGKVFETEKAGVFEIVPDTGYCAFIDGKKINTSNITLPEGEHTVKFSTDTIPGDYEGVLVNGYSDGTFRPGAPATRYDIALAATRAASKGTVSEDCLSVTHFLESKNALPFGWDGALSENQATRAECIFILASLFDAHTDSVKLFDYADVPDDHIYADMIRKASSAGKIPGAPGESFFPDQAVSRLEMCEFLNAYLCRTPKDGVTVEFTDVSSEHYGTIATATHDRTSGKWDFSAPSYVLPEGNTEDYVKALHAQSEYLSPDEIRKASDIIAYAVRQNILSTPNTRDIYDLDAMGIKTVYYVSEKSGNDANDGLSPQTAFKTPAMLHGKIQKKQNVAVLFERGGIYRTGGETSPLNLAGSKNIVIGSYGEGQKPVVMQSRMNYANAEWKEVLPNVYRLETTKLRNVGVMAFDHDITDYSDGTFEEACGEIENIDTQGFTGIHDLDTDLQFYCELQPKTITNKTSEVIDGVTVTTTTVTETYDRFTEGYLYLYSEHGNPSERFSSIEIGENFDLVDGAAHGCVIDNISFKFTGAHGIGLATSEDLTVKNCIFSWLGGSILWETERVTTTIERSDGTPPTITETFEEATGYGNAVEIYGGCDGFHVCDNWIYQIFDDGITNQYHGYDDCIQKDMRYIGNLLEYVYHDFSNCNFTEEIIYEKDFPTEGDGAYTDYTADLVVSYNICRMAGYGWGGPMKNRVNNGQMYRSAGIGANKDELVSYNIFDSSGGYLIYTSPNANETYDSNIYIQTAGTRLIGRMQVGNFPFTSNAHRDIIFHVNDKNAVTVFADSDTITDCRKTGDAEFAFIGAQIRTEGVQGLRFVFSVERSALQKLAEDSLPKSPADKTIGFGAVIMPLEYLKNGKLTKNAIDVSAKGIRRSATVPAVNILSEDENNIYFTACVSGIMPLRYNVKFAAVPYITYEEDGAEVTKYGDTVDGISLFDIALEIYEDVSVPAMQRMEMYKILSKVMPDIYPPIEF
ncbi:MAG: S-layer homology domain-containing protein [Clostridia bacterium]|nr:S-layer homology domain-containing protein [Clostridia bacterium]